MTMPPVASVPTGITSATGLPGSVAAAEAALPEDADADNDPEPPELQPRLWSTSTSSLTKTMADLRRGLAGLAQLASPSPNQAVNVESTAPATVPGSTNAKVTGSSASTASEHDSTSHSDDANDASENELRESEALFSSGGLYPPHSELPDSHDDDVHDEVADTSQDLFRVPSRFAMPVSSSGTVSGPSLEETVVSTSTPRSRTTITTVTSAIAPRGLVPFLNTKRLVQLSGPGSMPMSSADIIRLHGVPVGMPIGVPIGGPGGLANMTGVTGQRGSVAGTLAGSLHGGVNVLLGGAMLSGLILLVFFICYCCQRSARKSDAQFRTTYWLPDPDGPLEVFTLDAQSQRLERAGAVFLPSEAMEAANYASPSPPPAYHTVVSLPPSCSKQRVNEDGVDGVLNAAASPTGSSSGCIGGDATSVKMSASTSLESASATTACIAIGGNELDADGLPSYEAALKLESQGHI